MSSTFWARKVELISKKGQIATKKKMKYTFGEFFINNMQERRW